MTGFNIANNTANSNVDEGIYLYKSSGCNITNNIVNSSKYYGIRLSTSTNNNVTENNITNNYYYGMYLDESSNNKIYHNNFINNNKQAYDHYGFNSWDKGPLVGGNYWSDHACHGNPSNGTEPYTKIDTDAGAVDNYPFEDPNGWTILPPPLPDLVISASDVSFSPESPYEGEIVTINATVHNIGTKNASNIPVRFFVGADQIGSDQVIDFIGIGGEETGSITWNTSGEAGGHIITVKVDPDNEIYESSETNNEASKSITVYLRSARFDTGYGTYPSIMGIHNGTITPSHDVVVNKMYTYACKGTGGHAEHVVFYYPNGTIIAEVNWKGYVGDWHNITFDKPFTLNAGVTYNYTIRTGSYSQIHHNNTLTVPDGEITCTEFIDVNGKRYDDWVPAIRLE